MARKLDLADQLELVAQTPQPFAHYARFDALAFTSWEDSFGLVVLENMALGNLVACFAGGGGAPEMVGDAGLVVPDFSPVEMAKMLAQTWEDEKKRREMQSAGVKRAEVFSAENSKTALFEIVSNPSQHF